jgi:hypothetical protein
VVDTLDIDPPQEPEDGYEQGFHDPVGHGPTVARRARRRRGGDDDGASFIDPDAEPPVASSPWHAG